MPDAEFPVGRCATCAKDVLCHVALEGAAADDASVGADVEVFRCVACSTRVPPRAVRWLGFHDIEDLGYGFVLPEAGCGRPDCGQGRCGRA